MLLLFALVALAYAIVRLARAAGRSAEPRIVERIVERQVLVERCTFCGKLTPVDLEACAECGAKREG